MENQKKFLQNVEEERFLLVSNPKTGGKLVENWRETECISFVSFNGNPGKNEGLNFEEHEGHH